MPRHARVSVVCSAVAVAMALSATACLNGTAQSAASVTAVFGAALEACATPAAADGSFDQKAIAAAGWRVTSRVIHKEAEERSADLASLPSLQQPEYESTRWTSAAHVGELELSRWPSSTRTIPDACRVGARLRSSTDVETVVRALSAATGVGIAWQGEVPRGGDHLLPRSSKPYRGYRWRMPLHEVRLTVFDANDVRLDIEAAPGEDHQRPLPGNPGDERPIE